MDRTDSVRGLPGAARLWPLHRVLPSLARGRPPSWPGRARARRASAALIAIAALGLWPAAAQSEPTDSTSTVVDSTGAVIAPAGATVNVPAGEPSVAPDTTANAAAGEPSVAPDTTAMAPPAPPVPAPPPPQEPESMLSMPEVPDLSRLFTLDCTTRYRAPLAAGAETTSATLQTAWDDLARRLRAAGYQDRTVYPMGNGFMLVCPLEHIGKNGCRTNPKWGWSVGGGILRFFRSMVAPQTDFYRVIAVAVPSAPEEAGARTPDSLAVEALTRKGPVALSAGWLQRPFADRECDVMIYEFSRVEGHGPITFLSQPTVESSTHLVNAGLWKKGEIGQ